MNFAEIILIAFGVSIDAAAVSISGSLCPGRYSKRRCAFNAALFFGGFQFLMPLAGFAAAGLFTVATNRFNNCLAFILLSFVGGKMIWEACKTDDDEKKSCPMGEFFSPLNLLLPAVATSLDALAIGASLAFSGDKIWLPAIAMGIITALTAGACVLLGKKLAASTTGMSKRLTIAAGAAIILVGIKILLQELQLLPLW